MKTLKNSENYYWVKKGLVKKEALFCRCGKEAYILSVSNWHNGTGVLYMKCACGKEWNVRWGTEKLKNKTI